jgi:hypothetical protein
VTAIGIAEIHINGKSMQRTFSEWWNGTPNSPPVVAMDPLWVDTGDHFTNPTCRGFPYYLSTSSSSGVLAAGSAADGDGVCVVQPDKGNSIIGSCTPRQFIASLSDGSGLFNFTLPDGGFAFHQDIPSEDGQTVVIRANNNSTKAAPLGGTHFTVHARMELERIRIEGSRRGVAFMMGAAAFLLVDRCEFVGNIFDFGGAIAMINGELRVISSLFERNVDSNGDYGGGAIYMEAGVVAASDSHFKGNSAATRGGAIFINGGGHDQRHGKSIDTPTVPRTLARTAHCVLALGPWLWHAYASPVRSSHG